MATTLENTLIRFNDGTTQSTAATTPPAASTTVAGIVQLSTATDSTSTTLAATASAVKAAYDLAAAATTTAEAKLKTGAAAGTHYQLLGAVITAAGNTAYTKAYEARVLVSGTFRTHMVLTEQGSGAAYARIYKNGVAVGTARSTTLSATYTEDLAFAVGDLFQVYAYNPSSASSVSFRISIGASSSNYGRLAVTSGV